MKNRDENEELNLLIDTFKKVSWLLDELEVGVTHTKKEDKEDEAKKVIRELVFSLHCKYGSLMREIKTLLEKEMKN